MRLLGLSIVLLAACSTDNPVFGLTNDPVTSGPGTSGATTTAAPPTSSEPTGEPLDTSATSAPNPTTNAESTGETGVVHESTETTAVGETTLEPMTTMLAMPGTVDTTDTEGTTTDPAPTCPEPLAVLPSRVVKDIKLGEVYQDCIPPMQTFIGHGKFQDGALQFSGGSCGNQPGPSILQFGNGYPFPFNIPFCGETTVYWAEGCQVGAISVKSYDPQEYIFAAYYSPTETEPSFPFTPDIDLPGTCGCPDMGDNCCAYEPGEHNLLVDGFKIPPNVPTFIMGQNAVWHNFKAYMADACVDDLDVKIDVAWMAHRQF